MHYVSGGDSKRQRESALAYDRNLMKRLKPH